MTDNTPKLVRAVKVSKDNPYLHVWNTQFSNGADWYTATRDPNYSTTINQPRVPQATGVHVVLFNEDKSKILVTREFRYSINDYSYQTPAGIIEKHLGVEGSALLELEEETGYRNVKHLQTSPPLMVSAGLTDENICIYFAQLTNDSVAGTPKLGDVEVITHEWLTPAEILALGENGNYLSTTLYLVASWSVLGNV